MLKKACLALAFAGVGFAAQISGALPLVGIGMTQNGADLSVSTLITSTGTMVSGPGSGNYSTVTVGDDFGPQLLNLTNLGTFTLDDSGDGGFGNFVASSGFIVQQLPNFLDVFIVGTFTPVGLGSPGQFDPTVSSLRISINQSGSVISEAITLNSPALQAPGVPEPATMSLLGCALVGVGLLGRKRLLR